MKRIANGWPEWQIILILGLLLSFGILVHSAHAQPHLQGGINFSMGFPQGDFERNVDNTGFGLGLDFIFTPAQSPIGFGANFGFLVYGSESREEPLSPYIPEVRVNVETSNSIVQGYFLGRMQPQVGTVRPYLDGLLGFNYFFTQTQINNQGGYDEEIASTTNFDDFAFSYGAGAGVMFQVYDGSMKIQPGQRGLYRIFIDLKTRYLFGGEAEYLKEGSIIRENDRVVYQVSHSETNLLTVQIGVAVEF